MGEGLKYSLSYIQNRLIALAASSVFVGQAGATTLNLNLGESADGSEFIFGQTWTNVGGTNGIASGNVLFANGTTAAGVGVSSTNFSGSGTSGANPSDPNGVGFGGNRQLDSMTTSLLFAYGGSSPRVAFDVTGLAGHFQSNSANVSVWIGLNHVAPADIRLALNGATVASDIETLDHWTNGTILTANNVDLSSGTLSVLVDGAVPHIQGIRITDGTGFEQQTGIEVNKVTGQVTLTNGASPNLVMRGYQLTSTSGLLGTGQWSSFESQSLDGGTWSEANPSSTQLAELNLLGNSEIALDEQRGLGSVYLGGPGGGEDLVFEYLPVGSATPVRLPISYSTTPPAPGDLNADGFVGAEDLDILLAHWGQTVPAGAYNLGDPVADGTVNNADLQVVLDNWGDGTPPNVNIPEPTSTALLALGGCILIRRRR
ncbi:MAG: PEP-CTERM sorting domain-containing protein [Planctomycetota bacterium]